MLWSSIGHEGYAVGIAHSESSTVAGPWTQEEKPVWGKDGGHGMVFRSRRLTSALCSYRWRNATGRCE